MTSTILVVSVYVPNTEILSKHTISTKTRLIYHKKHIYYLHKNSAPDVYKMYRICAFCIFWHIPYSVSPSLLKQSHNYRPKITG